MPKRIIQLTLNRFRGATNPIKLELDPSHKLIMIFGENGTGKSTLVDAIDAVCNREVGSVAFRKAGNAPWNYLPSLDGKPPKSFHLELTTNNGGRWEATLSGRSIVVTEKVAAAAPKVRVLRRSQLLTLIESEPAKRYAAISDFVNVEGVQKSEDALNNAVIDLNKRLGSARASLVEAQAALETLYQEHGAHDAALDAKAWATLRAAENQTALSAAHQGLLTWQQQLVSGQGHDKIWEQATLDEANKQNALADVETQMQQARGQEDTNRELLARLLAEAQGYVSTMAKEVPCPLCTRPIEAAQLQTEIAQQLTSLRSILGLIAQKKTLERELQIAQDALLKAQDTLLSKSRAVAQCLADNSFPGASATIINFDAQLYADLLQPATSSAQALKQAVEICALVPTLLAEAAQQSERIHNRLQISSTIQRQLQRVQENELIVLDNTDLADRMDRALTIARAERRAYTQTILDDITAEVNRLYRLIHPAEDIGLDKFKLDDSKKASLEQYAVFCGKTGILPQAYFSESHLDTFGFCLWLALAKRAEAAHTVLVLDDVFTSVDMPHFRRITDLLGEEAECFQQLIIATHNRNWHELYKQEGVNAQLIKLEEWNFQNGVRAFPEKILTDTLADTLQAVPFNRQAVGSQAGILLEAVLDELTLIYGCSLKRKYGNSYELGDLLSGTHKLLQKAVVTRYSVLPNGQFEVPHTQAPPVAIKALHDTVAALKFIRNEIGCHFNRKGNDYPDADVRTFGEATLALVRALICPRCGRLPRKEVGAVRVCACPKLKTEISPVDNP